MRCLRVIPINGKIPAWTDFELQLQQFQRADAHGPGSERCEIHWDRHGVVA
jgi:hypothetical protein